MKSLRCKFFKPSVRAHSVGWTNCRLKFCGWICVPLTSLEALPELKTHVWFRLHVPYYYGDFLGYSYMFNEVSIVLGPKMLFQFHYLPTSHLILLCPTPPAFSPHSNFFHIIETYENLSQSSFIHHNYV